MTSEPIMACGLGDAQRVASTDRSERLRFFCDLFLGYGSLSSTIWFVGAEAGGGADEHELMTRANVWSKRGCHVMEDLQGYHRQLGLPPEKDCLRKLNKTWGSLIRILLAWEGRTASLELVKNTQFNEWGRKETDRAAILDLSQLSAPGSGKWPAGEFNFPWCKSREVYKAWLWPARVKNLKSKIDLYRPKIVLFHGAGETGLA